MARSEARKGKNYSDTYRESRFAEEGFRCEGCGREIRTRRTADSPNALCLEGHHEIPITLGGDQSTPLRVLCGPGRCHKVADKAVLGSRISFSQIVDVLGEYPFKQYLPEMEEGKASDVAMNVIGRVRRGNFEAREMLYRDPRRRGDLRAS